MSGTVNKVILIGNLGADPELKYTSSNQPVCNVSMATSEKFKDKSGNRQEKTEWHRVTIWGQQGENCAKWLKKGSSLYVEGRLQTRKWQDKDGKDRYSTDIVATATTFLGGGGSGERAPANREASEDPTGGYQPEQPPGDEDVPF
jgi:single-strand DNA-binding protein